MRMNRINLCLAVLLESGFGSHNGREIEKEFNTFLRPERK